MSTGRPASQDDPATTVAELASAVKSANAGASWLTFDLFFESEDDLLRAARALTPDRVASLYGVSVDEVRVFRYTPGVALKITVPRPSMFASVEERDFDGVQQHVPLLDVEA